MLSSPTQDMIKVLGGGFLSRFYIKNWECLPHLCLTFLFSKMSSSHCLSYALICQHLPDLENRRAHLIFECSGVKYSELKNVFHIQYLCRSSLRVRDVWVLGWWQCWRSAEGEHLLSVHVCVCVCVWVRERERNVGWEQISRASKILVSVLKARGWRLLSLMFLLYCITSSSLSAPSVW